jgi:membrane dipeptidase
VRCLSFVCAAAVLGLSFASHGASAVEPAVMVVDLHVDLPYQVHFKGRPPDLRQGHSRLDALTRGAYGGIVLPIYLPDKAHEDGAHIADAEAVFAVIERIIDKNPIFLPLRSRYAHPGRISTFLAIEGAGAFAEDITAIDRFIERGVRLVGPAHAANSPFASAATGEKVAHGLTPLGKEFCKRIYERGALVDVSHLSDAAFADVVPIARSYGAPIVATHSNARAIAGHPRNLTDDELRQIAASGGVAGLNLHSPFVTRSGKATLVDAVAQLDYMISLAGIDHVAIGSDFDGGRPAKGLDDAGALPALADYLRRRGMTHDDVLKIFALNALRVLGWRHSGGLPPAAAAQASD